MVDVMRLGKMEDTIKVKYYTDTWPNGFGFRTSRLGCLGFCFIRFGVKGLGFRAQSLRFTISLRKGMKQLETGTGVQTIMVTLIGYASVAVVLIRPPSGPNPKPQTEAGLVLQLPSQPRKMVRQRPVSATHTPKAAPPVAKPQSFPFPED